MTAASVLPVHRRRPAPPVRIVHLGLGAFSRSHTAWYTAHASDAEGWGIAAYTGSSHSLASALTRQDGVYTLVTRTAEGDRAEQIESIVRAHPGGDLSRFLADLAASATAVVTLTITEAGYLSDRSGVLDISDSRVHADQAALSAIRPQTDLSEVRMETALGRLVLGLEARRRAGGGPLTILSCDNLPDNGGLLRACLLALAASHPPVAHWCAENVAFASSSIDRITPRTSDEQREILSERYGDASPVVAEEFSDWVISGRFPAGRPDWESAGARFTDELAPWEARKLWMLNGAHTLLAALGSLRGHADVSRAIGDPVCRAAVEAYWDEAERHLEPSLEIARYRSDLIQRFSNPRIVHSLSQIALDARTKLGLRIAPVAIRERARGATAQACARAFAAVLMTTLPPLSTEDIRAGVRAISLVLGDDPVFVECVVTAVRTNDVLTVR